MQLKVSSYTDAYDVKNKQHVVYFKCMILKIRNKLFRNP